MGIVDATPILHTRPVGGGYARAAAVAEARAFLAERPYVTRAEARGRSVAPPHAAMKARDVTAAAGPLGCAAGAA